MSDLLLSVVVPVASVRPGLERCVVSVLESLKGSSLLSWELIIKDSSKEGADTLFIARRPLEEQDHIYIARDHPREMADSWNECFRLARGQYVHVMHDDDWVRPDFYPSVHPHLLHFYPSVHPHLLHSCDAVCTGYEVEEADGVVSFENRIKRRGGRLAEADLLGGNPLVPSCVVVRKDAHQICGGYGPTGCMDWALYLKLARYNDFYVIPELLVRQVRGSESQEGKSGRALTCQQITETIREWEAGSGERMPARDTYLRAFVSEAVERGDVELFKAALELRG